MTEEPQQDRESPLKQRREELGLTQRDIAQTLGKTVQTISNWETGIYEPKMTPREIKVLCRLLNWTLEEMPDEFGVVRSQSEDND
ncbi:MAG TPA: XRE family transcriptional regulator [Cyanobacteria bacterium UBA11162]|nr:XRE family transcriptional regulator [Cyanobacteria bacterium UBA11162]